MPIQPNITSVFDAFSTVLMVHVFTLLSSVIDATTLVPVSAIVNV